MTRAKAELLAVVREFGGPALRDLWVFDADGHEALFVRDDVREKLEAVEVDRYIDNERYGYVTRDTYNQLYYAEYAYTIRGFDRYEQFRTFVGDDGLRVGLFASLDRRDSGYDFRELDAYLRDVFGSYEATAFAPDDNAN